jgi:hypothetical protein
MNIIFKEALPQDTEKYTILELDTFVMPDGARHTAYCVVENVPIMELGQLMANKDMHAKLIENYAKQNWNFCEQAIEQLAGKWGGEVDTFYQDLQKRVQDLKEKTLTQDWSPVIHK